MHYKCIYSQECNSRWVSLQGMVLKRKQRVGGWESCISLRFIPVTDLPVCVYEGLGLWARLVVSSGYFYEDVRPLILLENWYEHMFHDTSVISQLSFKDAKVFLKPEKVDLLQTCIFEQLTVHSCGICDEAKNKPRQIRGIYDLGTTQHTKNPFCKRTQFGSILHQHKNYSTQEKGLFWTSVLFFYIAVIYPI